MHKVYTYICVFMKLEDHAIWTDVMQNMQDDSVIFKVVCMTNMYLFNSRYNTYDLRNMIDELSDGSQTFFLKREKASEINERDYTIFSLDDEYSQQHSKDRAAKPVRNEQTRRMPESEVEDIDWTASSETILDKLLERIAELGIESLGDHEREWLRLYSRRA